MHGFDERFAMKTERDCEIATLGGGCFWCLEAVFQRIKGVISVDPGYCGGGMENPTYQAVCAGETGHAEVVRIAFDPGVIDYATLLDVFFATHDPTTLNRQGHDVGTQYRSVMFYHSPQQRALAGGKIAALDAENAWGLPLVTELVPEQPFYPAEGYHQRYFQRNPGQAYCQAVIAPKLEKQLCASSCAKGILVIG